MVFYTFLFAGPTLLWMFYSYLLYNHHSWLFCARGSLIDKIQNFVIISPTFACSHKFLLALFSERFESSVWLFSNVSFARFYRMLICCRSHYSSMSNLSSMSPTCLQERNSSYYSMFHHDPLTSLSSSYGRCVYSILYCKFHRRWMAQDCSLLFRMMALIGWVKTLD